MIRLAMIAALAAAPALAQDFSEGSEAREWGLYAEQKARFTAVVSDPLCELAGDCTDDCGGGRRQVVLIRTADNAMVFPLKNAQSAFNGAVADVAPFCGQTVEVDGLLIEDPEIGATNVYLVQRIRPEGGAWQAANIWTDDWAAKNPDASGKGPWFRRDPRILGEIEKEGYLGLGKEIDEAFIADWF
ncbi:hypothetical protein SAMN05444004_10546 [Jannaschia faecimaris]|uniref:Uncharacterized protein n=1 Tax=Jannaschia faecimaris TaxID=1244108 RepID=A0A1H3PM82_9RHOB|nr:hypothetical protein [Jannaschia faecimaris]SDZ01599.1 hypothetical protein SAMN05444004_10546 [Jannaschia faecimaris]